LIHYDKFTDKNNNHIWLEFTTITMKKSQLLDIVCSLTLFTMISSANAAIIASDDTTITSTDQSNAQSFAAPHTSFSGVVPTLDELVDTGQPQSAENFNSFVDSASSESPHRDYHISLWLLLIVASVFGVLSEIIHRRGFNQ
jgi:hypothetical protein